MKDIPHFTHLMVFSVKLNKPVGIKLFLYPSQGREKSKTTKNTFENIQKYVPRILENNSEMSNVHLFTLSFCIQTFFT